MSDFPLRGTGRAAFPAQMPAVVRMMGPARRPCL